MRVLALDTATAATTVALMDAGPEAGDRPGPVLTDSEALTAGDALVTRDALTGRGAPSGRDALTARDDPPPGARPNHARALLGLVEDVLARGGGWQQVDRIAVGVGPGTFTGLRIGIATAQALARARELPLVGVSTLQSLALGAAREELAAPEADAGEAAESGVVLAVIDARRGEAFVAGFAAAVPGTKDPVAEPAIPPAVLKPEALGVVVADMAAAPAGGAPPVLAVGDGAIKFRAVLEAAGARVPPDDSELHRVDARHHCVLAAAAEPAAPSAVQPSYLRLPDAETSLRK